jgi:hypothetical protein
MAFASDGEDTEDWIFGVFIDPAIVNLPRVWLAPRVAPRCVTGTGRGLERSRSTEWMSEPVERGSDPADGTRQRNRPPWGSLRRNVPESMRIRNDEHRKPPQFIVIQPVRRRSSGSLHENAEITVLTRPSRMQRRRLLLTLLGVLAFLGLAEAILRASWGFGTPILYEWDRRFEYRMVPNQAIRRFGKRIEANGLGLRGREFSVTRSDPDELRVLVVGDSVINGGSHVDQSNLATVLLERTLTERFGRPVLVINASANSWGPPNQVEFIKAYGTFDADIVIVVASSHDLVDVPVHTAEAQAGSGSTFNAPWCALSEVAALAWGRIMPGTLRQPPSEADATLAAQGLSSFRELLDLLRPRVQHLAVAMHWDRDEQTSGVPWPAHDTLTKAAAESGVSIWELGPAFVAAQRSPQDVIDALDLSGPPPGNQVMHDRIHPSELGQMVIAGELLKRLEESGWCAKATHPTPANPATR